METKTPITYAELSSLYQMKKESLLHLFSDTKDPQNIYQKIMELGQTLPSFPEEFKIEKNLVHGCQSIVYLHVKITTDGKIEYSVHSDALISSGLAALLLSVYHLEKAELILTQPPHFLEELGLSKSLSPGRSNGLASIYSRMKEEATKLYLQSLKAAGG